MELKQKNSFNRNLLLSLLAHVLFAALVLFTPQEYLNEKKPEVVQVDFISPKNAEQKPKKQTPKIEKMLVVDQDETPLNDEKSDSKYLSAHNQVVKKQTVAQNRGEFKNSPNQNQKSGDGGEKFKPMTVEDFKPKFDIRKAIQEKVAREQVEEKQSEEDAIKKFEERANAQPPIASAKKPGTTGDEASQTIDYIKDLDPGLETLLSTKEFVYYTYYARIRRQLNQYWGPKVREKLTKIYQQGRTIASSEDKITKLLITLDKAGKLVKAQVIGDSGIHDLDEAAVEAFRAAAPFPNPPTGIIDPDGMIKIRWDFILEA